MTLYVCPARQTFSFLPSQMDLVLGILAREKIIAKSKLQSSVPYLPYQEI